MCGGGGVLGSLREPLELSHPGRGRWDPSRAAAAAGGGRGTFTGSPVRSPRGDIHRRREAASARLGWGGVLSRHRSPASCKVTWWLVAHAGRGLNVRPSFAALRLWRQLQPVQVSARGWRGSSSSSYKSSPWRPPPRGPGNVSRQLGRAGGESVQPVQSLPLSPHRCSRAASEPRRVRLLRGWSWGACSAAECVSWLEATSWGGFLSFLFLSAGCTTERATAKAQKAANPISSAARDASRWKSGCFRRGCKTSRTSQKGKLKAHKLLW